MRVEVQSKTPEFKAKHRAALVATMGEYGQSIQDANRERLDNPYPPASSPGESPHRRTGNLQAGAQHTVIEHGEGVRTVIHYERLEGHPLVPIFLENGTVKMAPRPFIAVERDAWYERAPAELPGIYAGHVET